MSRLTPIYTIYGLLSTTSGLGVRHTDPACQTAGLLGPLQHVVTGSADGVVGNKMTKLRPFGTENQVFPYALGDEGNCNFTYRMFSIFTAIGDECPACSSRIDKCSFGS